MGLISFLRDAGEKLIHGGSTPVEEAGPAAAADASAGDMRNKEQALEQAILGYMTAQDLPTDDVSVSYDATSATVTISGTVADQATREKMVLCCGNVQGVAHVEDALTVSASDAGESTWYTVRNGDSLSKIAGNFYGDPSQYEKIFEANQPMLSDPSRIYPGQTLRIPQHV